MLGSTGPRRSMVATCCRTTLGANALRLRLFRTLGGTGAVVLKQELGKRNWNVALTSHELDMSQSHLHAPARR